MSGFAKSVYRSSVVRVMPLPLRNFAAMVYDRSHLFIDTWIDARRYARFATRPDSAFSPRMTGGNLEAQLVKDYHRIEKGLALAHPRQPFGLEVRKRLVSLVPTASASDDPGVQTAAGFANSAVAALDEWNSHGHVDEDIAPSAPDAGSFEFDLMDRFFESRHSLRNFDRERPVTEETLSAAARWASRTPSVCNRQAGRVHVYQDRETIDRLLRLQAGNAGFGETVPTLIAFTVESKLFAGANERNQRWIDGALYAMTFNWALHAVGVEGCMLNWSKPNGASVSARKIGGIPDSEDIICLMAVGYPATGKVRVARSPRNSVSRYMTIHN